jgi:hypothetical protein
VPIKNRTIGPMEISCVLNIVFSQPPNGVRKPRMLSAGYPLVCLDRLDNQVGRDNATLTESTPSLENSIKTRTAKRPTTTAPTLFVGDRVHALLGSFVSSGN